MAKRHKDDDDDASTKPDPTADLLDPFGPIKVAKIFPTNEARQPTLMENYRPKEGKCLDYHLSETYIRWDVGDTKIRAKEIHADYVRAPPGYKFKNKPVFSTGGPPCWKWIDEVWMEKVERRQATYKENFADYLKGRRQQVIEAKNKMHEFLSNLAGPLWYQELSPKQMDIIDNLQWCIDKDLQLNTIDYTKDNLARLGLMLRANSKCIKLSLKYCCGKDFEFLLILYQVSHPERTTYSINDRLLLSSVVHLCMTETLREMHVRMPSPPRKEKKKKIEEKPKRPKKQKYDSPYLEPYTFQRDPPKHTGDYKKNLIQYPESPYFSYRKALYLEILNAEDPREIEIEGIDDPVELELIEDMQKAQITYNRLPHKTQRNIVKPTIKERCEGFIQKKQEPEPEEPAEVVLPCLPSLPSDKEPPCTCDDEPDPDEEDPICCPQDCECDCPDGECDCKRLAREHMLALCKRCDLQKRLMQRIVVSGYKVMPDESVVPILNSFYKEKECECMSRYKSRWEVLNQADKMQKAKIKYIVTGVCYGTLGAFYILQAMVSSRGTKMPPKKKEEEENECGQAICTCAEVADYALQPVDDPETKPRRLLPWETAHCRCKEELEKFLALRCECADCKEQERKKNRDWILGGTKQFVCKECRDSGDFVVNVPIISGIQDLHCDCLERYREHVKKLDEYKRRITAKILLKSQENTYAIGGVVQTRCGPVYNITGMRSPFRCICREVDQEMREEEEERNRMPKMPPTGRAKYAIGGVHTGEIPDRPEGENVFILTHALPARPCKCHRLYDVFEEEHHNCMDQFEEYLKKTAQEVLTVRMEEAKRREKQRKKELEEKALLPEEEPCECEGQGKARYEDDEESFDDHKVDVKSSSSSTVSEDSLGMNKCECTFKDDEDDDDDYIPCKPCNVGLDLGEPPQEVTEEREVEKAVEEEAPDDLTEYELKRFFIFSKIPCNEAKQMEILKKILATLAEDGFPIAKLPECHKLPIFKLWMLLRCGKSWKLEERPPFNKLSTKYYMHTAGCYYNIPIPTLPVSKKKALKLTWKHAEYVKAMIEDLSEDYYRQIKQQCVHGMREYYPAVFNYEFPEFRQCLFSYLPSKEEDVIVKSPVF